VVTELQSCSIGAPVPEGADAVVQIENTEQLPERQDGEKRIRIVKVSPAFCHQSVLNMDFGTSSLAVCFDMCKCLHVPDNIAKEAEAAEVLPAFHVYGCTITVR